MQGHPGAGEMVEGASKAQLTLLSDISGAFRPGVLTCLMGVSGAGKTTLLDLLAGRKTGACLTPRLLPSAPMGVHGCKKNASVNVLDQLPVCHTRLSAAVLNIQTGPAAPTLGDVLVVYKNAVFSVSLCTIWSACCSMGHVCLLQNLSIVVGVLDVLVIAL